LTDRAIKVVGVGSVGTRCEFCAYALAHSHARYGKAGKIAGYLGKSTVFDKARLPFATRYADRAEADFRAFAAAVSPSPSVEIAS